MKKILLTAFFSLLLFSIAFAAIDTSRPGVMMVPRSIILDVSCFLNDARVASSIQVIELDTATGNSIDGTAISHWTRDGRWTFQLTPGKSYRISGTRGDSEWAPMIDFSCAPKDINNLQHSTAIGLTILRTRATP
jgi:hypothetical protein